MKFSTPRARALAAGAALLGPALVGLPSAKAAPGDMVEYAIPQLSANALNIAPGGDGNLWFTESNATANKIGKITTAGVISEFLVPTASAGPSAITAGPNDGNMWFTEVGCTAGKIGKINTTTNAITEYQLPTVCSKPRGITVGPDNNIWFTEAGIQKIGKLVPATGAITEYSLKPGSDPFTIVKGPDNNLWVTQAGTAKIARVNLGGPKVNVSEWAIPNCPGGAVCIPFGITVGPDGNMWYTTNTGLVGSITTAGVFGAQYNVGGTPKAIVTGPDGNLWFPKYSSESIARMTTAGVVTQWVIPGTNERRPIGITRGPDDGLWFTENLGNKIGRISAT